MSNKNLLNEATIRRFMKLAGHEALTSPLLVVIEDGTHRETAMTPMKREPTRTVPSTRCMATATRS